MLEACLGSETVVMVEDVGVSSGTFVQSVSFLNDPSTPLDCHGFV